MIQESYTSPLGVRSVNRHENHGLADFLLGEGNMACFEKAKGTFW